MPGRVRSGQTEALEVPKERVSMLANEVLPAVFETVRKHKVSYDEFNALKAWLIGVGEDGEWPLFLDVWVEHVIEEVSTEDREGNKGTIEGPYYVPGSPSLETPATLPMRADEGGRPLLFQGQVRAIDGTPLAGAHVEFWHAWRPAHLHLKVSAPGHQLLTAQLYFEGDQHLSDDIASAVKPELVLRPQARVDAAGNEVTYDLVLDAARG